MGSNNREFILAIVLSAMVLITWQVFFGIPQLEQERARQQAVEQTQQQAAPDDAATRPAAPDAAIPSAPGSEGTVEGARSAALTQARRVPIETASLTGSVNLRGARLDDLRLKRYHETVEPDSPIITLLSPSGSPHPYYVEHGWTAAGEQLALPDSNAVWTAPEGARLTEDSPLVLTYEAGSGLVFQRTISVDENYMFTVRDEVRNTGSEPRTIFPYGLVSRHGEPETLGYFVLHEGLIGVLGDDGLIEIDYDDLEGGTRSHTSTGGWIGITDKYWAVTLVPEQTADIEAKFREIPRTGLSIFQTDYIRAEGMSVPAGGSVATTTRVFAGAKVVSIVDGYKEQYGIERFDLLIDWGWFYFITKPLFRVLEFFHQLVGNFGVAILIVTVIVKLLFFPLANKSYVSMSKMKKLQPEMLKIRERYPDDRMKQQEAMMALYKKEQVNPMSGCLPIALQIPVFFALYKVLFVTIEMRHAPFFGWIKDLAAPDPTTIFNLFGLIPWDPPSFLMVGAWPLIMGVTMFIQMRLNPPPPDPIQAQIFNWMPVVFTFMLATFPAGLIIYWAWNNLLSVAQQALIMHRQGVKVELWDNLKSLVRPARKPADPPPQAGE